MTLQEIEDKLTYDHEANFAFLSELFTKDMEAKQSGKTKDLELAENERKKFYNMVKRSSDIMIFKSFWVDFDVSELDGKEYILDKEEFGPAFGDGEEDMKQWARLFLNAQGGAVDACLFLAEVLAKGHFSLAMTANASKYWKIAAQKGNATAMYNLGMCYRWGDYGEYIEPEQALYWFKEAAKHGDEKSGELIAQFDNDTGESIMLQSAISGVEGYGAKWFKSKFMVEQYFKGADAGDAEMQYELARQSVPGLRFEAFRRKPENAVKYYTMAAEQGMIDAMFNLANLYEQGCPGMEPELAKAVIWRKRCADAGDAESEYLLANMYRDGRGVEKDLEAYRMHLKKAADGGFEKALSVEKRRNI